MRGSRVLMAVLPVLALVIGGLLLASCGGDEESEATEEETRVAVTYDGTSCVYTGPETVKAGLNDLAFDNQSDTFAETLLIPIAEGFTADEVLADLGESGTFPDDTPDWVDLSETGFTLPSVRVNAGSARETAQRLDAGTYVILVGPGEETTLEVAREYLTAGSVVVE